MQGLIRSNSQGHMLRKKIPRTSLQPRWKSADVYATIREYKTLPCFNQKGTYQEEIQSPCSYDRSARHKARPHDIL